MAKVLKIDNKCISCKNYIPIGNKGHGICLDTRKKVFNVDSCKNYKGKNEKKTI